MSAWVVPLDAFDDARIDNPVQQPTPLPYLRHLGRNHFDIELEVALQPANGPETVISRSNTRHLYWSAAQLIAHHTVNGCNLQTGDILATGTISGDTPGSYGSLLELSGNGKTPLVLPDGSTRTFLEDGDTLTLRGWAGSGQRRVELGDVSGQIC